MTEAPWRVRATFRIGWLIGLLFGPLIFLMSGKRHIAFGHARLDSEGHWTASIIRVME